MDINITRQMEKILKDYSLEINEILNDIAEKNAKKGLEELKRTSPRRRRKGKTYHKSWKVSKEKNGVGNVSFTIYNAENYRLTHLLERGHRLTRKGKTIGKTGAKPHIEPIETKLIENFTKEVINELEK